MMPWGPFNLVGYTTYWDSFLQQLAHAEHTTKFAPMTRVDRNHMEEQMFRKAEILVCAMRAVVSQRPGRRNVRHPWDGLLERELVYPISLYTDPDEYRRKIRTEEIDAWVNRPRNATLIKEVTDRIGPQIHSDSYTAGVTAMHQEFLDGTAIRNLTLPQLESLGKLIEDRLKQVRKRQPTDDAVDDPSKKSKNNPEDDEDGEDGEDDPLSDKDNTE